VNRLATRRAVGGSGAFALAIASRREGRCERQRFVSPTERLLLRQTLRYRQRLPRDLIRKIQNQTA
jgi:hypothetical protein